MKALALSEGCSECRGAATSPLPALTESQQQALSALNASLNVGKDACLSGHAGTGKTLLTARLLSEWDPETAVATAPTHKAVMVLSDFLALVGSVFSA
jgi:MoxR-like ATPase